MDRFELLHCTEHGIAHRNERALHPLLGNRKDHLFGGVKKVQGILRFANQEKIPVVPYTAGTNIGGLTIPERGGILLDLKRMNRIIEIDPEALVAVIEPGVSHAQLAAELAKYKLPKSVVFVDALPRTAAGKVLKRELREQYGDRGFSDR
jgi:acyl-CoA synthetase (AMP-forming)/AMP-acid ligase II